MLAPNLHFESLTQPLATTLREKFSHRLVVITAADIQRQPQALIVGASYTKYLRDVGAYPGKDPVPA